MEKELDIPKDRPTLVLEKYLDNEEALRSLLSNTQAKDDVLDKASVDIGVLDANDTNSFVKMLLNGLSRDDQQWDVNKRDGALELFDMVDFNKIPRERLLNVYPDSISTQNEDSDPWGSIYSLIEAGKTLAPFLPFGEKSWEKVRRAWDDVASKFSGEDKETIEGGGKLVVFYIP